MDSRLLAALLPMVLSGCMAIKLAIKSSPIDCRDDKGVPIACPDKAR